MTDTVTLRREIEKNGLKYKHIALQLGITPYGLQKKIKNNTEFKAREIAKLCDILSLSLEMKEKIFFTNQVE